MQVRLQKLISQAGLASRREAEVLIERGEVRVNDLVIKTLGEKADPEVDDITVNGVSLRLPKKITLIALHKPRGYLVTREDPEGRKTIYDLLPPHLQSLKYVGRLDFNSEGLLLLTNDGELIEQLTRPQYGLKKCYRVTVSPVPTEKNLEHLRTGGGTYRPLEVEVIKTGERKSELKMTLTEGKNREIRNLCESVGLSVKRLTRLSVGAIELGDLPLGKWCPIDPKRFKKPTQTPA